MATNRVFHSGDVLTLAVASPTQSGDPVVYGTGFGGVALTDYKSDTGTATIQMDGVFDLSVEAVNADGNVAIAVGDRLYFTTGDTPVLNRKSSGIFFGWALEAIDSGETDTINVRLAGDAGRGTGAEGVEGIFVSSEQTGNGSEQSVTHGLGRTPTKVLIAPTEWASGTSVDIAQGTHTGTVVKATVTTGVKYTVFAA